MRVAEQPGGGVAKRLVAEIFLAVRPLADREIAGPALVALAADDGEGDDDAVALLELAVHAGTDLHDFAHGLMAKDVAGQHRRDEVVVQVEVRAAYGAARHLDDRVTRLLDFRICDRVVTYVFLAVPYER